MRALLVGLSPEFHRALSLALPERGCGVEVARTTTEALAYLSTPARYQLIVVGESVPGLGHFGSLAHGAQLVWARPGISLSETVDAIRAGAADVWESLPSASRLEGVLSPRPRAEPPPSLPGFGGLVTESSAMREVMSLLAQAAPTQAAILFGGETGTGKGALARWVHDHSPRRSRPFVVVDCAGLATSLAENELFGHARGAFTGADRESGGRFEAAEGGTLFLDEIGELPVSTQQKLLRFLEEGEVERLGEVRPRQVDARVVAASHRDLRQLVEAGRFREDLLYRLEVVDVWVPPLRERPADIPPLIRAFVAAAGGGGLAFEPAAQELLLRYRWPGNVRELRNVVDRALVLRPRTAEVLGVELLPSRVKTEAAEPRAPAGAQALDLETSERMSILEALRRFPKLDDAAAALGIDPSTLWRKRKRFGIE
jgi:two-component system, NtrC family, response regulator AlgB